MWLFSSKITFDQFEKRATVLIKMTSTENDIKSLDTLVAREKISPGILGFLFQK